MPNEYKGNNTKANKYVNSSPRRWTEKEINWCLGLKEKGYSYKEISKSVERTHTSVSIKMKRLKKKDGSYNSPHIKDKHRTNEKFIQHIKPKTLLDVYAGDKYYNKFKEIKVTTNDIDNKKDTDFNMDAHKLLCKMYLEGNTYDVVDLDPFGSAFDCFDLAIKMAKKGLIITLGEMGHKRFKRLDFVKRYYNIEKLEDFTTENIVQHIKMIGRRNKKELIVKYIKEWNMVSRVYFEIRDYKITEQWE